VAHLWRTTQVPPFAAYAFFARRAIAITFACSEGTNWHVGKRLEIRRAFHVGRHVAGAVLAGRCRERILVREIVYH
jgi:hypothetical protein